MTTHTQDKEQTMTVEQIRPRTICEAFQATAASDPDAIALRTAGGDVEISWCEYARRVERIAAGLAGLGIGRGDAVALMMTNRPEFNLCDTAALHLGATPFSIYNTFPAADRSCTCSRTRAPASRSARSQFAERPAPAASARTGPRAHRLRRRRPHQAPSRWPSLERAGSPGFDFEAAWRAVESHDVLTLIYTSGTTGPPKGVELHPREHARRAAGDGSGPPRAIRRPRPVLSPLRAHRRPLVRPLSGPNVRRAGHLRGRPVRSQRRCSTHGRRSGAAFRASGRSSRRPSSGRSRRKPTWRAPRP